jgi:hypothetical protein
MILDVDILVTFYPSVSVVIWVTPDMSATQKTNKFALKDESHREDDFFFFITQQQQLQAIIFR